MNVEDQKRLLEKMDSLIDAFCSDHKISKPKLLFRELDGGTYARHVTNEFGECFIKINVHLRRTENQLIESLYHELTHHWQKKTIGYQWYDKNKEAQIKERYPSRWKRFWHSDEFRDYLESSIEVEARSFARSMMENKRN